MDGVLFSRIEDGFQTVTVDNGVYRVLSQEGVTVEYPSARQMLKALTGHPEARHWTAERYFKQGKYRSVREKLWDQPGNQPSLSVLDLWTPTTPPLLTVCPSAESVEECTCIAAQMPLASLTVLTEPRLGVDLLRRGKEVAKLFYAGFGSRVARAGFDPEDVLQEVYRGLLIRNQGTCPWDVRKSSFGHYVHMVCGCIVSNYFRRENRRRSVEQIGVPGKDGFQVDAASDEALVHVDVRDLGAFLQDDDAVLDYLKYVRTYGTPEARAHLDVAVLMCEGSNRLEAARSLQLPINLISRLYSTFHRLLSEWNSTPVCA